MCSAVRKSRFYNRRRKSDDFRRSLTVADELHESSAFKHVEPNWYGESVGHFEGDTLVVDTIGIGVHPEAGSMEFFGTPHTRALHLIKRYRLLGPDEKSTAPRPPNDSFDAMP